MSLLSFIVTSVDASVTAEVRVRHLREDGVVLSGRPRHGHLEHVDGGHPWAGQGVEASLLLLGRVRGQEVVLEVVDLELGAEGREEEGQEEA